MSEQTNENASTEAVAGNSPVRFKTSVEVEVTPNITLETELGENAEGGVGLNWKRNY